MNLRPDGLRLGDAELEAVLEQGPPDARGGHRVDGLRLPDGSLLPEFDVVRLFPVGADGVNEANSAKSKGASE